MLIVQEGRKVEVGIVPKTVISATIWETSQPDESYNTQYV